MTLPHPRLTMGRLSLVLALTTLAACIAEAPDAADPTAPSLAKAGGNLDIDSHANWTFYGTLSDGLTPTGIYGDSRGLDGGPSGVSGESAYPGETCGVRGKLFNGTTSGSGDAVFAPAFSSNHTACGDRSMTVKFDGGNEIRFTPFTNAQNAWDQAELQTVGGSFVENMGFSSSGVVLPCGTNDIALRYLTTSGSGVRVTRLANQGAARVWRVESVYPHSAGCWATVKGKRTQIGPAYVLPFHAMIVEVPAPSGGW